MRNSSTLCLIMQGKNLLDFLKKISYDSCLFGGVMRFLFLFLVLAGNLSATVIAHFRGQFGNQLFQAAAAISLAMDNNCGVNFPDFAKLSDPSWQPGWDLRQNYTHFFQYTPNQVADRAPSRIFVEPYQGYHPIPYQPNIEIDGYFLSEKYFYNHRDVIKELFAAPKFVLDDLKRDFGWLIEKKNTVAIHVRTGYYDYKLGNFDSAFYSCYLRPDLEFYKKAIELFDPDSLFVVISDYMPWCKQHFQGINRKIIYIEHQDYIHDFYLITMCKHAIIANSSFGWWAAYLNKNDSKKIVCRTPFFGYPLSQSYEKPDDLLCEDWIRIPGSAHIPFPEFPVEG